MTQTPLLRNKEIPMYIPLPKCLLIEALVLSTALDALFAFVNILCTLPTWNPIWIVRCNGRTTTDVRFLGPPKPHFATGKYSCSKGLSTDMRRNVRYSYSKNALAMKWEGRELRGNLYSDFLWPCRNSSRKRESHPTIQVPYVTTERLHAGPMLVSQ